LNKAVFLDRDGVINVDRDYVHKIEEFEFKDGIFELLKHLRDLGYLLIVVTNQSGIGRGYYSEEDFRQITKYMLDSFIEKGIEIAKVMYCPHAPEEECRCRKPDSLMIEESAKELQVDLSVSWLIGDKKSDIQSAKKAGVAKSILVSGKKGEEGKKIDADFFVNDLKEIEKIIGV